MEVRRKALNKQQMKLFLFLVANGIYLTSFLFFVKNRVYSHW